MEEDGAFVDPTVPIDEAIAAHSMAVDAMHRQQQQLLAARLDPPDDDEPPSLSKRSSEHSDDMYFQYDHEDEMEDHDHDEDQVDEDGNYFEPEEGDEQVDEDDYYDEPSPITHPVEAAHRDNHTHDENRGGKYFLNSPQDSAMSGGDNDYMLSAETEESEQPSPDHKYQQQEPEHRLSSFSHKLSLNLETEERSSPDHRPRRDELPPVSPRSPSSESPFPTTPAMRGAQELLRRNRQRRALSLQKSASEEPSEIENSNPALTSPQTDSDSGATWESGSDFTGSSVWTDNSNNPERSSRRALILQMARARMKNNRSSGDRSVGPGGITGGGESVISERQISEEKKVEDVPPAPPHTQTSTSSGQEDFDLTGDLD